MTRASKTGNAQHADSPAGRGMNPCAWLQSGSAFKVGATSGRDSTSPAELAPTLGRHISPSHCEGIHWAFIEQMLRVVESGRGLRIIGFCCLAWCAIAAGAANSFGPARVRLQNGRQLDCEILARSNDVVFIQRVFGAGVAREQYPVAQIESILFPRPAFLSVVATQALPDTAALRACIKTAEQAYAATRAFADVKGTWAYHVGFEYARLLEQARRFSSARRIYDRVNRAGGDAELRRSAALRSALCAYYSATPSNALQGLLAITAVVTNDGERAAVAYYTGMCYAQLGQPVASLFALLRNVVLYSLEPDWEPRSLVAALPNYAALERGDEFRTTCATLVRRFPATPYAAVASNMLVRLAAGTNVHACASLSLYPVELRK